MDLFDEIISALQAEDRVMLATIISTTGSTPAAAFSRMLVKQGGVVSLGTVGGGCMEGDVLLQANRLLEDNKASILKFHLNEDDLEHGLICGGSLDILIEPLSKERIPLVRELKRIRDSGEDCILATHLSASGNVSGKCIVAGTPELPLEKSEGALTVTRWIVPARGKESEAAAMRAAAIDSLLTVRKRHETAVLKLRDGDVVLEPVAGAPSLLLFGGGHVSKYVSRSAAMAGFRVTVIDDRDTFANRERFPEAAGVVAGDFLDAIGRLTIGPSTYVVIVTRGHRHDEEILARVASTTARYIGMIGSKRKVLATFEHLLAQGIAPDALARVHAPMGIDIGAATAEEIGISIVAELIGERRGSGSPFKRKSDAMKSLLPGSMKSRRAPAAPRPGARASRRRRTKARGR